MSVLIDFHVHMGDTVPVPVGTRREMSVHQWIDRMNREGIDMAVLLPLESPEVCPGYWLTREALGAAALYPERLIPFVNIDPRMPKLPELIRLYESRGCCGFGELYNGLPFDDPLNRAIYRECADRGWAMVFDMGPTYLMDEVGLPRLERCLREFPDCVFVGHGPGFWTAISGDDDRKGGYPTGPIRPGGAVDRLMSEYPNLWADLSAGSGYNAMTRDPDYTEGFLQRHWQKLLFATDVMYPGQELPQMRWLREVAPVNDEQREAIAGGNALRVLRR